MKKRIAMASILALLLLGTGMGALPAEAASRNDDRQIVVHQGYSVSWSSSDPSDVRVDRTPGRAEHFPRAASTTSTKTAKSRVAALASTSLAESDSCTAVPDRFGSAIFTSACARHDLCYSSSTDRLRCDQRLLLDLRSACYQAYWRQPGLLLSCYTVAAIYYVGVRLFGGHFYAGTGNPA
jgi:phospholipase A2-like protein